MRIAIIGGGISGLATAYRLFELQKERRLDLDVVLFEAQNNLGGTIQSEEQSGFLLEKGPDSFLTEKSDVLDLCKRLGIEKELLSTNSEYRTSFIVKNKKLIPVPGGFYLIAPTDWMTFLKSELFSWPAKLRMGLEWFLPPSQATEDESVGKFIRRRFGREALDRAGQPMLAGIYTADPETLSLEATMPRFRQLERSEGSVIRGLMKQKSKTQPASGPRYSLFMSFQKGMKTLIGAIQSQLPSAWIRTSCAVESIQYHQKSKKWTLKSSHDTSEDFDVLILSGSAQASSKLLKSIDSSLSQTLNEIQYQSVATLNFAFHQNQIHHPLNGFGFVVPQIEKRSLIACSFSSVKFNHRAPQDKVLLRAFVGGAFGKEVFNQSDETLKQNVLADLKELLFIEGEPIFLTLHRFSKSMVEYRVGHLEWLKKLEAQTQNYSQLHLIGSSFRGVGISQCVKEAQSTAEQAVKLILQNQPLKQEVL